MYNDNIEVRFSTKHLPFEYKWLEFRLIVNKELYDEQAIDLKTYSKMQESILARMKKIKNEYKIGDIKKLVSLFCTVINKIFKICPIFIFYKRL